VYIIINNNIEHSYIEHRTHEEGKHPVMEEPFRTKFDYLITVFGCHGTDVYYCGGGLSERVRDDYWETD